MDVLYVALDRFRLAAIHSDHFEIDRRRSGLVRLAGEPAREPGLVKSGGGATDRMDLGASDRTPYLAGGALALHLEGLRTVVSDGMGAVTTARRIG